MFSDSSEGPSCDHRLVLQLFLWRFLSWISKKKAIAWRTCPHPVSSLPRWSEKEWPHLCLSSHTLLCFESQTA